MSILQNLNKEIDLTLEETLFIVRHHSINARSQKLQSTPTLHMKAIKYYNL
jgi:hypothetical protein